MCSVTSRSPLRQRSLGTSELPPTCPAVRLRLLVGCWAGSYLFLSQPMFLLLLLLVAMLDNCPVHIYRELLLGQSTVMVL